MRFSLQLFYLWAPLVIKGFGALIKAYLIYILVPSDKYGLFALSVALMIFIVSVFDIKIPQFINHFKQQITKDVGVFYGIFSLQFILLCLCAFFLGLIIYITDLSLDYVLYFVYAVSLSLSNAYISYFRVIKSSRQFFFFTTIIEIPSLIAAIYYLINFDFDPAIWAVVCSIFYLFFSAFLFLNVKFFHAKTSFDLLKGGYSSYFKKSYLDNVVSYGGDALKLKLISYFSLELLGEYKKAENVFSVIARFRASLKTVWIKKALAEVKTVFYPPSTFRYVSHILLASLIVGIFIIYKFPSNMVQGLLVTGALFVTTEIVFWLIFGFTLRSNVVGVFNYYIHASILRYSVDLFVILILIYILEVGVWGLFVAKLLSALVYGVFIFMTRKEERNEFL